MGDEGVGGLDFLGLHAAFHSCFYPLLQQLIPVFYYLPLLPCLVLGLLQLPLYPFSFRYPRASCSLVNPLLPQHRTSDSRLPALPVQQLFNGLDEHRCRVPTSRGHFSALLANGLDFMLNVEG